MNHLLCRSSFVQLESLFILSDSQQYECFRSWGYAGGVVVIIVKEAIRD